MLVRSSLGMDHPMVDTHMGSHPPDRTRSSFMHWPPCLTGWPPSPFPSTAGGAFGVEHRVRLAYEPPSWAGLWYNCTANAGGTWCFSILGTHKPALSVSQDLLFPPSATGWWPRSNPDPLGTRVPIKRCNPFLSMPSYSVREMAQGGSGVPKVP